MEKSAIHMRVTGFVQSVWFFLEIKNEARRLCVTGWIQGLWDGSVEAFFEGDKKALLDLVSWHDKGILRARVDKVEVTWQDYTGKFDRVSIL